MIFDPSSFLNQALPRSFHTRKLYDVDKNVKKANQMRYIITALMRSDLVETRKTTLNQTVQRAIKIYKNPHNESDNNSMLKHRIEDLLVYDKVQELKETHQGEYYRWLPSDAETPNPQHQLLYGKVFRVGEGDHEGNMPGERWGCRCSAEFFDLDNEEIPTAYQIKRKELRKKTKNNKDAAQLKQLEKYYQKEWDVKEINLSGLDAKAVKGTFDAMDKMIKEWPELKGHITKIGQSKGGIMSTKMTADGFRIDFNPKYYRDIKKIKRKYAAGLAKGYFPAETSWENAPVHELGHVLHGIVAEKQYQNIGLRSVVANDWGKHITTERIVNNAWGNIQRKYPKRTKMIDAQTKISLCARKTATETVAEAFSDVFSNGENAQFLSREIVKLLRKELN